MSWVWLLRSRKRKTRRDENYSSASRSPPLDVKANEHLVVVFRRSRWWGPEILPAIRNKMTVDSF
jgi:hypothetical protein